MLMQEFPPSADARVTLANWQEPPYNRWSFSHMRELVPTQRIFPGPGPAMPLLADPLLADPLLAGPLPPGEIALHRVDGAMAIVDDVLNETYTDAVVVVQDRRVVLERYLGETGPDTPHLPRSMYAYLTTLGRAGEHGGVFDYRSCETDVLGWVCERATKTRMADLVGELVWSPMGAEQDAEITCDGVGTPIHDGGMCATARDLAHFGPMLLAGGEVAGRRVVPAAWLRESWTVSPDIRDAFARSVS